MKFPTVAHVGELSKRLAGASDFVTLERSALQRELLVHAAAQKQHKERLKMKRGRRTDVKEQEEEEEEEEAEMKTDEAVIDEICPECDHPKMSFRTAQLRGLDEGQTIFYTCLNRKCRHKFTVNS